MTALVQVDGHVGERARVYTTSGAMNKDKIIVADTFMYTFISAEVLGGRGTSALHIERKQRPLEPARFENTKKQKRMIAAWASKSRLC